MRTDIQNYQKLSRIAYKHARAYGYHYMLRNPQTPHDVLVQELHRYLTKMEPWNRLTKIAERQSEEAAAHVLWVASAGQLEAAIASPQGHFPSF